MRFLLGQTRPRYQRSHTINVSMQNFHRLIFVNLYELRIGDFESGEG